MQFGISFASMASTKNEKTEELERFQIVGVGSDSDCPLCRAGRTVGPDLCAVQSKRLLVGCCSSILHFHSSKRWFVRFVYAPTRDSVIFFFC